MNFIERYLIRRIVRKIFREKYAYCQWAIPITEINTIIREEYRRVFNEDNIYDTYDNLLDCLGSDPRK